MQQKGWGQEGWCPTPSPSTLLLLHDAALAEGPPAWLPSHPWAPATPATRRLRLCRAGRGREGRGDHHKAGLRALSDESAGSILC